RRCERQPGKSKADLKGDSSRELDSAIQMRRPSAEPRDVFGNGITQQYSCILHVDSVGEFRKAVATHQQLVVGRDGMAIFVMKRSAVLEAHRDESFPFRLERVEFHAHTTDAHHCSPKDAFDLRTAEPHRYKRIFGWQDLEQRAAG